MSGRELGPCEAAVAVRTPIGWVSVVAGREGVRRVLIGRRLEGGGSGEAARWAAEAARQIGEYMAGRRRQFDVPLDLRGLSEFARRVLELCRQIPYGATASYGEIARKAGRAGAARAVGRVMARNPVPILVPCHRVVRADGALGGFGAGLAAKRELLALERRGLAAERCGEPGRETAVSKA